MQILNKLLILVTLFYYLTAQSDCYLLKNNLIQNIHKTSTLSTTKEFVRAIRENINDEIEVKESNKIDVSEETSTITLIKQTFSHLNLTQIQDDNHLNYVEVDIADNDLLTHDANLEYETAVAVPSSSVNEQNEQIIFTENENHPRDQNSSRTSNVDITEYLNESNRPVVTNTESLNTITEENPVLKCNNSNVKMLLFDDISQEYEDMNFVDYNTSSNAFLSEKTLNLKEEGDVNDVEKQTEGVVGPEALWTVPYDEFNSTTKIKEFEETYPMNSNIDSAVLDEILNEMNKTHKFKTEKDLVAALYKMYHNMEDDSVNFNDDILYKNKDIKSHMENEPFQENNNFILNHPVLSKVGTDTKLLFNDTIDTEYDVVKYPDDDGFENKIIEKNNQITHNEPDLKYVGDKDLKKIMLSKFDKQDSGTNGKKLGDIHTSAPIQGRSRQPSDVTDGHKSIFNKTIVIKFYIEETDQMYAVLILFVASLVVFAILCCFCMVRYVCCKCVDCTETNCTDKPETNC